MAGGYNNHKSDWNNNKNKGKQPYNQKDQDNKTVVENFIPIPDETKDLLKNSKTVNFGLYSPRMTEWMYKETINNKTKKKEKEEYATVKNNISDLMIKSKILYENIEVFIAKKNKLLNSFLVAAKENGYIVYEKTMYTKTPFISGLGSGHPTETGMILDRNLGVPYIPASSVKGVCRLAYAINNVEPGNSTVDDSIFEKYFGSTSDKNPKRGKVIFLDVYPLEKPELKLDIMNPHFQKYYNGDNDNTKPLENEDPVPINFLVVSEGCGFTFRCLYKLSENEKKEDIEKDIEAFFETAFTEVGFGGKTAVGYGRFQNEKIQKRPQIQQQRSYSGDLKEALSKTYKSNEELLFKGKEYEVSLLKPKKEGKKWRGAYPNVTKPIVLNKKEIPGKSEGDKIKCRIVNISDDAYEAEICE